MNDIYEVAEALGADLWEAGHKQWSDEIDNAIAGGATASEILMALRWTLGQLLDSKANLSDDLERRAKDLQTEISNGLA